MLYIRIPSLLENITVMTPAEQTQLDEFKEAACELETDDHEARFDGRVRKLVKHRPAPEKPE